MNNLKEFIKLYNAKLKNDPIIAENKKKGIFRIHDYIDRISFHVVCDVYTPGTICIGNNYGIPVISLDKEDLEYLFNKYSKKLQDERRSENKRN